MGSFIAEDDASFRSRAAGSSFSWSDDSPPSAGCPVSAPAKAPANEKAAPAAAEQAGGAAGVGRADGATPPPPPLRDTQREKNHAATSCGLVRDARVLARKLTLLAEGRRLDRAGDSDA